MGEALTADTLRPTELTLISLTTAIIPVNYAPCDRHQRALGGGGSAGAEVPCFLMLHITASALIGRTALPQPLHPLTLAAIGDWPEPTGSLYMATFGPPCMSATLALSATLAR